jgi:quinol-cytochrome oxidoreductase complex cytochrome b subunit
MTPSSRRPSFFEHLHPPTIPAREARFRYNFGLGGLSLFLFLVLAVTGALEMFYYVPSPEGANASVKTIAFLVPFGWLIRNLHYWAAQAMLVTVGLHALRVILTGAYKPPRRAACMPWPWVDRRSTRAQWPGCMAGTSSGWRCPRSPS